MPHERNMYHAGVDVLERIAKDKNTTIILTVNKNGRWAIKNGMLKGVANNFVNAIHEFCLLAYPLFKTDK